LLGGEPPHFTIKLNRAAFGNKRAGNFHDDFLAVMLPVILRIAAIEPLHLIIGLCDSMAGIQIRR
jgi:hypothetical protein